ncbi:hypothetical protein [Prauserella muralis]|uniref:hypothetical protein n=1 Tax=Prauserella muralis TaxID=588067 RepID=UPI0011AC4C93|nr:hypothetical protein [Prauserella muralis]TWE30212.1 hypothetical protein FHX69_2909 [Prauserella muralis]
MAAKKFRVLTGMNFRVGGRERRAEPGEIRDDIPAKSRAWLLEQGHIEPLEDDEQDGEG